ncbi:MAG: YraN family protein [Rhodospirillales bacterium]|nr:YraN family protein [Rhodospirillales bacterium]
MSGRSGTQKRQRARRLGRAAEAIGALWLRLAGYRILARDFRVPVGEIDIVALRGTTLAFIEVKARADASGTSAADEVLSLRQRRRIARAAESFLKLHPHLADRAIRFDLIVFGKNGEWCRAGWCPRTWFGWRPRHVTAAWRTDD